MMDGGAVAVAGAEIQVGAQAGVQAEMKITFNLWIHHPMLIMISGSCRGR